MKTKQPTQRNYHWLANKITNFFARIDEDLATVAEYRRMNRILRVYADACGCEWVEKVVKQSAEIVFKQN